MKYMGSKARLLSTVLGEALLSEATSTDRFVDLFSGSGSVSHFVAEHRHVPVLSVDVQEYARPLALAVTARTRPTDAQEMINNWVKRARELTLADERLAQASWASRPPSKTSVLQARRLCRRDTRVSPGAVWAAYGGHYFSPLQALAMDALLSVLPTSIEERSLAMATILRTASHCSASPGHTAQPFQPSPTSLAYIRSAWNRDVFDECEIILQTLSRRHALRVGEALVADGTHIAAGLNEGDVVFCDPPYSEAQYSRFYHVLEGIARGGWPVVSGNGRAPSIQMRHASAFSLKSQSHRALEQLLRGLLNSRTTVIFTFPSGRASNGVSGTELLEMASSMFTVESHLVPHVHSTLGGVSASRGARRALDELVLILRPK